MLNTFYVSPVGAKAKVLLTLISTASTVQASFDRADAWLRDEGNLPEEGEAFSVLSVILATPLSRYGSIIVFVPSNQGRFQLILIVVMLEGRSSYAEQHRMNGSQGHM